MLTKLEDQLFDQMNRLANAPPDEIANEVSRSEAMCRLTGQAIEAGRVGLSVVKLAAEYGSINQDDVPKLLGHTAGPRTIAAAAKTSA